MLHLQGMSATLGTTTFSKHERKPQENIMKRAASGSLKLKNFVHQGN